MPEIIISPDAKKSLHTVAEDFRKGNTVDDLDMVLTQIGGCIEELNPPGWGTNEEDEEYLGYLEEASAILLIVKGRRSVKKKLLEYINHLSWENFWDDEEDKAYSLGSMFWNKMQWISEGCKNMKVSFVAATLSLHIKELFDNLEIFANE